MVSNVSSTCMRRTIVVHSTGGGGIVFFGVLSGVVIVTCVRVSLVFGGVDTLVGGGFFFKVRGCYEDGATEFTDVDAAEGGVLFDVEPEI